MNLNSRVHMFLTLIYSNAGFTSYNETISCFVKIYFFLFLVHSFFICIIYPVRCFSRSSHYLFCNTKFIIF